MTGSDEIGDEHGDDDADDEHAAQIDDDDEHATQVDNHEGDGHGARRLRILYPVVLSGSDSGRLDGVYEVVISTMALDHHMQLITRTLVMGLGALVVLPETDVARAMRVAERLREATEALQIDVEGSTERPKVTVSCGVADFPGCADNRESLIAAADSALLFAKKRPEPGLLLSRYFRSGL